MDFHYLDSAAQRAQYQDRLRSLEQQYFSISVSRLTFEASGDVEQLKANAAELAKLDAEYKLVEQRMNSLPSADAPVPPGPAEPVAAEPVAP